MRNQDSIVTARVPKEIRDQGDAALKRIDSTVTELINAAFEYVVKTGSLPSALRAPLVHGETTQRKFDPEQKAHFEEFLIATSVPLSSNYDSLDAKQIREMRLAEKYGY